MPTWLTAYIFVPLPPCREKGDWVRVQDINNYRDRRASFRTGHGPIHYSRGHGLSVCIAYMLSVTVRCMEAHKQASLYAVAWKEREEAFSVN